MKLSAKRSGIGCSIICSCEIQHKHYNHEVRIMKSEKNRTCWAGIRCRTAVEEYAREIIQPITPRARVSVLANVGRGRDISLGVSSGFSISALPGLVRERVGGCIVWQSHFPWNAFRSTWDLSTKVQMKAISNFALILAELSSGLEIETFMLKRPSKQPINWTGSYRLRSTEASCSNVKNN